VCTACEELVVQNCTATADAVCAARTPVGASDGDSVNIPLIAGVVGGGAFLTGAAVIYYYYRSKQGGYHQVSGGF
jgi:hypothetical protein